MGREIKTGVAEIIELLRVNSVRVFDKTSDEIRTWELMLYESRARVHEALHRPEGAVGRDTARHEAVEDKAKSMMLFFI